MQTKTFPFIQESLRVAERAVVLLATAVVPLFHWPGVGGTDPFVIAKTILIAWVIGLFVLLRSLRLLLDRDCCSYGKAPVAWLGLILIAASAGSLLANPEPFHFFRHSILQWALLFWMWLLIGLSGPERILRPVLWTAVVTGTLVALIAMIQLASPETVSRYLPYHGAIADVRHNVFSTLGNPEHLGGYLAAILIVSIGLMLQGGSFLQRAFLVVCVLVQVVVLVRTGARGAWLGAFAGMLVLAMAEILKKENREFRKIAFTLTGILVIAGGLVVVFSTPNPLNPYRADFLGRIRELGDPSSESVRHRLALLSAASHMILVHPVLGVGPGRFSHEFYNYIEQTLLDGNDAEFEEYVGVLKGRKPGHAHNDLLEFWAETGTLGIVAFVLLVGYCVAKIRRGIVAGNKESAALSICVAFVSVIIAESLFGFPLHLPARGMLFWTLLICGACATTGIPIPSGTLENAEENPLSAEQF